MNIHSDMTSSHTLTLFFFTISSCFCPTAGHAFNNIPVLPLLVSLDLSYNTLADYSLSSTHCSSQGSNRGGRSSQRMGRAGNTKRLMRSESDTMPPLLSFHDKFSALEHLDLSWNVFCDLGGILNALG